MCMNVGMIAFYFLFSYFINHPLVLQTCIGPIREVAAPLVPRALSCETSGHSCSPGLLTSPCPPKLRLTGWSVRGIAHERRAHHCCGLSLPRRLPRRLPPVLRHRPQWTGHISMVDAGRGAAVVSRPASVLNPLQCLCLPLQTTSSLILYLCFFKLIPSLTYHHLLPPSHPNTLPSTLKSYHTQYG